jgi:hypothetical protein
MVTRRTVGLAAALLGWSELGASAVIAPSAPDACVPGAELPWLSQATNHDTAMTQTTLLTIVRIGSLQFLDCDGNA